MISVPASRGESRRRPRGRRPPARCSAPAARSRADAPRARRRGAIAPSTGSRHKPTCWPPARSGPSSADRPRAASASADRGGRTHKRPRGTSAGRRPPGRDGRPATGRSRGSAPCIPTGSARTARAAGAGVRRRPALGRVAPGRPATTARPSDGPSRLPMFPTSPARRAPRRGPRRRPRRGRRRAGPSNR